jgi:Tfp pilus assembly protein PilF
MIPALLIAASVVAAAPPTAPAPAPQPINLSEAVHAIAVGRLDQARIMLAKALAAGVTGPRVDTVLADLAFASGNDAEALARYQQLLKSAPDDARLAECAGIAALRVGDVSTAIPYLDRATASRSASWRAWNARGAAADLKQDWATADQAYLNADRLSPNRAEIINNHGWSQLLRGNWRDAGIEFERAAKLDPKSTRIANNLELAKAAMATGLPERQPREADSAWAARLNDAGIAAEARGDRQRAVAAFTQALEASGRWYARAANNLQRASGTR